MMTPEEVKKNSLRAYNNQKELWLDNCKKNKKNYIKKDPILLKYNGQSTFIFSFGPSCEKNILDFKNAGFYGQVKIMCVDKALGLLLKHDIIPDFVVTADGNLKLEECVDMNTFNKKICQKITLFACVISHPSWAKHWKNMNGDYYFYINKDGIRTHHIYREYFNYDGIKGNVEAFIVPAATNVGNQAYVTATLVLGFKNIYLCGFDYCFKLDKNKKYYGDEKFNVKDRRYGVDKRKLNNHISLFDMNNDLVQTSASMHFSCRWLIENIKRAAEVMGVNTVNLTGSGILTVQYCATIRSK